MPSIHVQQENGRILKEQSYIQCLRKVVNMFTSFLTPNTEQRIVLNNESFGFVEWYIHENNHPRKHETWYHTAKLNQPKAKHDSAHASRHSTWNLVPHC